MSGTVYLHSDIYTKEAVEKLISEAVTAERERCAKIVEDMNFVYSSAALNAYVLENETQKAIAAEIREGK